MHKILIIDDDEMIRFAFCELMKTEGFQALEAADGKQGMDVFRNTPPDAVVLDLMMKGMDGLETMKELHNIDPSVPVIIATGYGNISTAVKAIKLGAYDFITKPLDLNGLMLTLRRAVEKLELEREVKRLHKDVDKPYELFLGRSPAIKEVISQIQKDVRTNFSLIIQGETGTGKSYIANVIHGLSKRFGGKFVTIDMGAIPESLIESELFGHEKGAFTGADSRKAGLFQIANGGTVLIDELQNMSPNVQSKLLRVIEEKKVTPLGSLWPASIDVRIIAATNTDIAQAVAEKSFRQDLFFRLGEIIIKLPALRERDEDIPILATMFFRQACEELDKNIQEISDGGLELLRRFPWPGNIRQLKNAMRRAVLFCSGSVIKEDSIKRLLEDQGRPADEIHNLSLKDAERRAIKRAMELANGNKTKASSLLQIDYTTLLRKIKTLNIN